MKISKTSVLCMLLSACYFTSSSQEIMPVQRSSKPKLFSDMPQKMRTRIADLESLLELPVGASVNTSIAQNFNFQGTVVSVSPADEKIKTVVVKSTNRKGATLSFSRTIKEDGTVKYLGRVISLQNDDAFELVKENNQYILQKKNLADLMTE